MTISTVSRRPEAAEYWSLDSAHSRAHVLYQACSEKGRRLLIRPHPWDASVKICVVPAAVITGAKRTRRSMEICWRLILGWHFGFARRRAWTFIQIDYKRDVWYHTKQMINLRLSVQSQDRRNQSTTSNVSTVLANIRRCVQYLSPRGAYSIENRSSSSPVSTGPLSGLRDPCG